MYSFEEVVSHFDRNVSLTRLTDRDVELLVEAHPEIPADYRRFLREVGYGDLGEIQLYSGPVSADSVYPRLSGLQNIVLFGDDFQGYCFGFDLADHWRIVEVSPSGQVDRSVESLFIQLLGGYVLSAGSGA